MIEMQEIRLGNWFNHNEGWSYREKSGPFQWEDRDWFALGESCLFLDNIDPIPLTPELLGRLGFYESPAGRLLSNGEMDMLKWAGGNSLAWCEWNRVGEATVIMYMWYLHELQNLFFAISKREMMIKPTALNVQTTR